MGLTREQVNAGVSAAVHSAWVSFLALAGGLLTAAAATGNATSPTLLIAYVKANGFGYVIANLIAPSIRAAAAVKRTAPTS